WTASSEDTGFAARGKSAAAPGRHRTRPRSQRRVQAIVRSILAISDAGLPGETGVMRISTDRAAAALRVFRASTSLYWACAFCAVFLGLIAVNYYVFVSFKREIIAREQLE